MLNSGTAWKVVPDAYGATGSTPFVKHPTTAWPPSHGPRAVLIPEDVETPAPPTVRRAARPVRQSPTVPWFLLLPGVLAITLLIMMVVNQRAALVKQQYALVDLKTERSKVLKKRAELKLSIQGLTALERVDAMVRQHLKMTRPAHRIVLDLTQARLETAGGAPLSPNAPSNAQAFAARGGR